MIVAKNERAFVLTGAPGVGKTCLLEELRRRSFNCVLEPARIVLAEQRAQLGAAVPEKDSKSFCDLLLERSIQDYRLSVNSKMTTIFDRGVPDNVAYASGFGLDLTPFNVASASYIYNEKVFLLSPWDEIYETDDERKMNFRQVCEFHKLICNIYRKLSYKLIDVPRAPVEERANFIEKNLSN